MAFKLDVNPIKVVTNLLSVVCGVKSCIRIRSNNSKLDLFSSLFLCFQISHFVSDFQCNLWYIVHIGLSFEKKNKKEITNHDENKSQHLCEQLKSGTLFALAYIRVQAYRHAHLPHSIPIRYTERVYRKCVCVCGEYLFTCTHFAFLFALEGELKMRKSQIWIAQISVLNACNETGTVCVCMRAWVCVYIILLSFFFCLLV